MVNIDLKYLLPKVCKLFPKWIIYQYRVRTTTALLFKWHVVSVMIYLLVASEFPLVGIKNNAICTGKRYTDAIVGETFCWVKIEHEN